MKKVIIVSLLALTLCSCMGKKAPDESMVIIRSESLRLPPEFEIKAPEKVTTIKKKEKSIEETSKELIIGKKATQEDNINTNTWILKHAGANSRIKNIKEIIKKDIAKAKAEEDK